MTNTEKKRVMVVEDDSFILSTVEEILDEEGFEVITASNGQEALDMLKKTKDLPQLIIIDLMMPVIDGIGFRRQQELDSRISSIPLIVISADDNLESKMLRAGIRHHIKKPVDLEKFIATVNKFFPERKSEK